MDSLPFAFYDSLCLLCYSTRGDVYSTFHHQAQLLSGAFGAFAERMFKNCCAYARCIAAISVNLYENDGPVDPAVVRRFRHPTAWYTLVLKSSTLSKAWIDWACSCKRLRSLVLSKKLEEPSFRLCKRLIDSGNLTKLLIKQEAYVEEMNEWIINVLCQEQFVTLWLYTSSPLQEILEFWKEKAEEFAGKDLLSGAFGAFAERMFKNCCAYAVVVKRNVLAKECMFHFAKKKFTEVNADLQRCIAAVSVNLYENDGPVDPAVVRRFRHPTAWYTLVLKSSALSKAWIDWACSCKRLRSLVLSKKLEEPSFRLCKRLIDSGNLTKLLIKHEAYLPDKLELCSQEECDRVREEFRYHPKSLYSHPSSTYKFTSWAKACDNSDLYVWFDYLTPVEVDDAINRVANVAKIGILFTYQNS
uniref:Secreted protein n=1 Tax=Steinernema glaseri TaxID=37863 RepID=A0A1I8AR00_9BILA